MDIVSLFGRSGIIRSIVVQKESDMSAKLTQIIHYTVHVGLKIIASKPKVIMFDPLSNQQPATLRVGINEFEKFCYSGSIISKDGRADIDIKSKTKFQMCEFDELQIMVKYMEAVQYKRNILVDTRLLS